MDYTPGLGGGTAAITTGVTTAAVLPQTGVGFVNEAAIAAAVALAAWAIAYSVLSRRTA